MFGTRLLFSETQSNSLSCQSMQAAYLSLFIPSSLIYGKDNLLSQEIRQHPTPENHTANMEKETFLPQETKQHPILADYSKNMEEEKQVPGVMPKFSPTSWIVRLPCFPTGQNDTNFKRCLY